MKFSEEAREVFGGSPAGTLGELTPDLGQQDVEGLVEIALRKSEPVLGSKGLYALLSLGHWAHKMPPDWRAWYEFAAGTDPLSGLLINPDRARALNVLCGADGSWFVQSVSSAGTYVPISSWQIGEDIPIADRKVFVVPIEAGDCGRHWPIKTPKKEGEPRNVFTGYLVRRVDRISYAEVLAEFGEKAAACARQDCDSLVLTIEQVEGTSF